VILACSASISSPSLPRRALLWFNYLLMAVAGGFIARRMSDHTNVCEFLFLARYRHHTVTGNDVGKAHRAIRDRAELDVDTSTHGVPELAEKKGRAGRTSCESPFRARYRLSASRAWSPRSSRVLYLSLTNSPSLSRIPARRDIDCAGTFCSGSHCGSTKRRLLLLRA